MIKKECFKKVGNFDEQLKSCQDWDMWLRIAEFYTFDYVPELLCRIYTHPVQISNNFNTLIPGRTMMIEKHWDKMKTNPHFLINHVKRIGKLHFLNGTWGNGLKWFGKALLLNPFQIFKIIPWILFEYPKTKLFSKTGKFERLKK